MEDNLEPWQHTLYEIIAKFCQERKIGISDTLSFLTAMLMQILLSQPCEPEFVETKMKEVADRYAELLKMRNPS